MGGGGRGEVGGWWGFVDGEAGRMLFVVGRSGVVLVRIWDWWARVIISGSRSDIGSLKRSFGGEQHRWRADAKFGEKESVIVE